MYKREQVVDIQTFKERNSEKENTMGSKFFKFLSLKGNSEKHRCYYCEKQQQSCTLR